jgi:transposase
MEEKNKNQSATQVVKEIKRQTRRKFTAEEKIKIVLEGMRGEDTIAAIYRK